MITDAMQSFRHAIATEGDVGMLIAADSLEEQGGHANLTFSKLLRRYVEIQTYVRMSQVVPSAWVDELKALNAEFNTPDASADYWTTYSEQFGPFWLKLSTRLSILADGLDMLETQPIRKLEIRDCEVGNNLSLVLRNHRMDYIEDLGLQFTYSQRRQEQEVARALQDMQGTMLQRLSIRGVNNEKKIIPAIFQANRRIRKGCELFIGGSRVAAKR